MLKSLIRGKFIGSRSVNNPPEHFVNNQVLTVGIAPYARGEALTIHPSGILEFLFVFIVDFFELCMYNSVNKSQPRRNLT